MLVLVLDLTHHLTRNVNQQMQVILLGDLNWRVRLHPDEILARVAASAADCRGRVTRGKPPPGVMETVARDGGWRCVLVGACVQEKHGGLILICPFHSLQGPAVPAAVGGGGVGGLRAGAGRRAP